MLSAVISSTCIYSRLGWSDSSESAVILCSLERTDVEGRGNDLSYWVVVGRKLEVAAWSEAAVILCSFETTDVKRIINWLFS